jgi:hypothetical protein
MPTTSVRSLRFSRFLSIFFLGLLILSLGSCKRQPSGPAENSSAEKAPAGSLELVFPYGSEKEKWITDVTRAFNQSNTKTKSGKTIYVRAIPMGSGETIDNILSGRLQAHLASPASAAFIKLGNAESQSKTGKDLIASTDNLVLSPVVNLRAGNRNAAAQYALRLQTVSRELEENRKQLEQAETTYKDLLKARDVAVSNARGKIESLKSSISDMKMKRAMAELPKWLPA